MAVRVEWGKEEGNIPGAARADWQVKKRGHEGGLGKGEKIGEGGILKEKKLS